MAAAIGDLVERCVVVHITGPGSFARAAALRDALPAERRERYRPFAFLHEEMAAALSAADLLVGRAGSSTLAEAAAAGLPMIVVPYPHAAAHQRANAAELVAAGGARLVADEDLDGAGCARPPTSSGPRPGRDGRRGPLAGAARCRRRHRRPAHRARRRHCPARGDALEPRTRTAP